MNPRIEALRARWEADKKARIFVQLAEEYRKAGMYDEALQVCREGLENNPSYFTAIVTLGKVLMDKGDFDGAALEFKKVIEASPGNITANKLLGDINYRNGDYGEALSRYEMVRQLNPLDENIQNLIDTLKERLGSDAREKDFLEAHKEFEKGIPLDIDDSATIKMTVADYKPAKSDVAEEDELNVTIFSDDSSVEVSGGEVMDVSSPLDEPEINVQIFPDDGEDAPGPDDSGSEENILSSDNEYSGESGDDDFGLKLFDDESSDSEELLSDEVIAKSENVEVPTEEEIKLFEDNAGSFDDEPLSGQFEEDESEDEDEDSSLSSDTLAQLYERQGHPDKALKIYEKMLLRDPASPVINARIEELKSIIDGSVEPVLNSSEVVAPETLEESREENLKRLQEDIGSLNDRGRQRKIKTLNNWLDTVKKEKGK